MIVVQETTKWDEGMDCNHIYFLSDDKSKMFAYIKGGTTEYKVFSKPMGFDVRGRTFELLRTVEPKKKAAEQWKFTGSKGETYVVEQGEDGLVCSCPGFKFRGQCKHVAEIQQKRG